jgi:hypothetical protein
MENFLIPPCLKSARLAAVTLLLALTLPYSLQPNPYTLPLVQAQTTPDHKEKQTVAQTGKATSGKLPAKNGTAIVSAGAAHGSCCG